VNEALYGSERSYNGLRLANSLAKPEIATFTGFLPAP
jgi:hypothetical protein